MSTTEHAFALEEAAMAAAHNAIEASVELIRYAREGAYSGRSPFADIDVIHRLADALQLALDVEGDPQPDTLLDENELAQRDALKEALRNFIMGESA
jgi:hypothetical protein